MAFQHASLCSLAMGKPTKASLFCSPLNEKFTVYENETRNAATRTKNLLSSALLLPPGSATLL